MSMRLTTIPAPFIKLVSIARDSADIYVLGGIHIPPGSTNGVGRLYKIDANLAVTTISDGFGTAGKDDSLTLKILVNGTLRVTLSEAAVKADGTSEGGGSSVPTVYDFPNVFPSYQPPATAVDMTARANAQMALDKIAALIMKLRQV